MGQGGGQGGGKMARKQCGSNMVNSGSGVEVVEVVQGEGSEEGLTRCGGNLWWGGWTWARKRGGASLGTPGYA